MEENNNSLALVIKRVDWRENDARVVLYTKKLGKISLVARGAKRFKSKLAAHIEPLSLSRILVLKGKTFDYLGGIIIERGFLNIKKDLNALHFAGLAWSFLDKSVKEGEPDEDLFNFLVYWLELLNSYSSNHLEKEQGYLLYNYFTLQVLNILGYKPELYLCTECQKRINSGLNYFSLKQGGVIDENCHKINKAKYTANEVFNVSDDCIKLTRIFSERSEYKAIKVSESLNREMSRLIKSFISFNYF